jgi:hypothetical protein
MWQGMWLVQFSAVTSRRISSQVKPCQGTLHKYIALAEVTLLLSVEGTHLGPIADYSVQPLRTSDSHRHQAGCMVAVGTGLNGRLQCACRRGWSTSRAHKAGVSKLEIMQL